MAGTEKNRGTGGDRTQQKTAQLGGGWTGGRRVPRQMCLAEGGQRLAGRGLAVEISMLHSPCPLVRETLNHLMRERGVSKWRL